MVEFICQKNAMRNFLVLIKSVMNCKEVTEGLSRLFLIITMSGHEGD